VRQRMVLTSPSSRVAVGYKSVVARTGGLVFLEYVQKSILTVLLRTMRCNNAIDVLVPVR
jgi:hypothetical protein